MNARQRLTALLEYLQIDVDTLALIIGAKYLPALRDILAGETQEIPVSICRMIIFYFPTINILWVLNGQSPMILSQTPNQNLNADVKMSYTNVKKTSMTINPNTANSYCEETVDIINFEVNGSAKAATDMELPVYGNSMWPAFPSGSIAHVRRMDDTSFIPWGEPMVLDTENGIFLKILYPDPANPDCILATSYNAQYPSFKIPMASIHSMYRVLSVTTDCRALT